MWFVRCGEVHEGTCKKLSKSLSIWVQPSEALGGFWEPNPHVLYKTKELAEKVLKDSLGYRAQALQGKIKEEKSRWKDLEKPLNELEEKLNKEDSMKISVFVLVGSGVKIKLLPGLMDDEHPVNKAVDSNVRLVKVGDEFTPRVVGRSDLFYAMDNALEALRERLTVYRYELWEDLSLLEERLRRFDSAEPFEEETADADDKNQ